MSHDLDLDDGFQYDNPAVSELRKMLRGNAPDTYFDEVSIARAVHNNAVETKRIFNRMQESKEQLDVNHPMYSLYSEIHHRLSPNKTVETVISLRDTVNAGTYPALSIIENTAGMVNSLQQFLQKKGRHLRADHLAFIEAHELSHWDKEANVAHLNETYCDVNAIFMCSEVGYNLDCALEVLEFLEEIENDKDSASEFRIPITHPASEGRKKLGASIINDPNIHLAGRYTPETAIDETIIDSFLKEADTWAEARNKTLLINSLDEAQNAVRHASTISELASIATSAASLELARASELFSQSKEFGDLLLGLAVIYESGKIERMNLLEEQDYYALHRYNLAATSYGGVFGSGEQPQISPIEARKQQIMTEEEDELNKTLEMIFRGEIENPLEILINPKSSGIDVFKNRSFDTFFSELAGQANAALTDEVKELVGLEGVSGYEMSIHRTEDQHIPSDEARRNFLNTHAIALSASLISTGQGEKNTNGFIYDGAQGNISRIFWVLTSGLDGSGYEIDLDNLITQQCLDAGMCSTDEVAHDISTLLGDLKRIDFHRNEHVPAMWLQQPASFQARDDRVEADARETLFEQHVFIESDPVFSSIFHGDTESGKNRMADKMHYYFQFLVGDDNSLSRMGTPLDPYTIATEGDGFVPWNMFADTYQKQLVGITEFPENMYAASMPQPEGGDVYRFSVKPQPPQQNFEMDENWTPPDEDYSNYPQSDPEEGILKLPTRSPERAEYLLLHSHQRDFSETLETIMNTPDFRNDPQFIPGVIHGGMQSKSLDRRNLAKLVGASGNIQVYEMLKAYLGGQVPDDINSKYFQQYIEKQDVRGLILPLQFSRFVRDGGLYSRNLRNADGYSVDLSFYSYAPRSYTAEQLEQAGRELVDFIQSPLCHLDDNQKIEITGIASQYVRISLGLQELRGNYPESYADFGEKFTSMDQVLNAIERLPRGELRDKYLFALTETLETENDSYWQEESLAPEQFTRVFSLMSARGLNGLAIDRPRLNVSSGFRAIPVKQGAVDILDQFVIWDDSVSPYIGTMLTNIIGANYIQSDDAKRDVVANIRYAVGSHPEANVMRDFLMEYALRPLTEMSLTVDEQKELLPVLDEVFPHAYSARLKSAIGTSILRIRLHDQPPFDDTMRLIETYLPTKSSGRDEFVHDAMNKLETTWSQIELGRSYILGHSYATNTNDSALRSGIMEIIAHEIQTMGNGEKRAMLLFFLNTKQHISRPEELTRDFFSEMVRNGLIYHLTNPRYLRSDQDHRGRSYYSDDKLIKEQMDTIITRLMHRFRPDIEPESPVLPEKIEILIEDMGFTELLNYALPSTLRRWVKDSIHGDDKPVAALGIGTVFLSMPIAERRRMMFDICLGKSGILEDISFKKSGTTLIHSLITLTNQASEAGGLEPWSSEDVGFIEEIVTTLFEHLTPERRTEVLNSFMDSFARAGGNMTKIQMVKAGLLSFGLLGQKIGQNDEIMPPDWHRELASFKEDLPPIPKETIITLLQMEDRQQAFEAVGPIEHSGSAGIVLHAKPSGKKGFTTSIKAIRPYAKKTLDEDKRALEVVLDLLFQKGAIRTQPTAILNEMQTMAHEELDPSVEADNMKRFDEARKKTRSLVRTPQVYFVGKTFLEMERVFGVSLKVFMDKYSSSNKKYKPLRNVITDFFSLVSETGNFMADAHFGNYYIDTNQNVYQLDYGQAGLESDQKKRDALISYALGAAMKNANFLHAALVQFMPEIRLDEVKLLVNEGDIFKKISEMMANQNNLGSLPRFTKALVSASPLFSGVSKSQLAFLIIPHIHSAIKLLGSSKKH